MKKFAKMLALGLALAMTFGMVVSAAEKNPSTETENPKVESPENASIASWGSTIKVGDKDVEVTVYQTWATEKAKEEADAAISQVEKNPSGTLPGAWLSVGRVLGTYYLDAVPDADGKKEGTVVLNVSEDVKKNGLKANENYAFLHVKDGVPEYINLGKPDKDGFLVVTLKDFSAFALVVTSYNPPIPAGDNGTSAPAADTTTTTAPVSPKTGETLPVAGMMAVLCLAVALVCAKKARCNN